MDKLVVIIPVFNEESALEQNFNIIESYIKNIQADISYMLVDDGSIDGTWHVIEKLHLRHKHVNGIRFSRNFGKEFALLAGIQNAWADYYLVMDSDLQHPPQHVKRMFEILLEKKVNIVEGFKSNRGKETLSYKIFANSFYKILNRLTHMDLNGSSDFKIFDNQVASEIRRFKERNMFFRGIVDYVGFEKVKYPFNVEARTVGESSFSLFRLVKLALTAIVSHTSKPLYLTIISGAIFLILALVLGIQTLVNYFLGKAVNGFSTVILLILITGSMLMISIGVIGIYIANIYSEVKARPQFVLSEKIVHENVEASL